ncbi:hypothetical protein EYF80_013901 [Liparis tanakae]|uniref:Uncharacterized protein n=1 Tax=Liparis tanakae TaxID=230148 RepID=A0A4Z2IDV7_9TELE|nr:hypothetical protein EYF80_013901 [Liparis tanakae]
MYTQCTPRRKLAGLVCDFLPPLRNQRAARYAICERLCFTDTDERDDFVRSYSVLRRPGRHGGVNTWPGRRLLGDAGGAELLAGLTEHVLIFTGSGALTITAFSSMPLGGTARPPYRNVFFRFCSHALAMPSAQRPALRDACCRVFSTKGLRTSEQRWKAGPLVQISFGEAVEGNLLEVKGRQ